MKDSSGIFFCLTLVCSMSCIDPFPVNTETEVDNVVIDGWFTDNEEYNLVRLSTSAPFSNDYPFVSFNEPITGATVIVHSNNGGAYPFTEIAPGEYKTDAIGSPGVAYYLEVTLSDGRLYQSSESTVTDAVEVESMDFTTDQRTTRVTNSYGGYSNLTRYYFDVTATIHDPTDVKNYYLWKTKGVFEYITAPIGDGPCAYCFCWAELNTLSNAVSVLSDELVDGDQFSHKVTSIVYDRATDFLVDLRQFAVDAKAFEYWDRISQQQSSVGSIFDPTPGSIQGNVYRMQDTSEKVLGHFTTASTSRKTLLIKREEEARSRGWIDSNLIKPGAGNCLEVYDNATHIKPIEFYD